MQLDRAFKVTSSNDLFLLHEYNTMVGVVHYFANKIETMRPVILWDFAPALLDVYFGIISRVSLGTNHLKNILRKALFALVPCSILTKH